jgi:hypothetical protein
MPDLDAALFAQAEAQEFRNGNLAYAAVLYRTIARSADATVRVAALWPARSCSRISSLPSRTSSEHHSRRCAT